MSRKLFVATFLWAVSVVLAVHLLQFPGSVPDFERASGGGKLLDVVPSFSVDATYSRIEQYGEDGRRNYFFRNLSVDVILPLSLLPFLFLLMRRAISRLDLGSIARASLLSIPFAYVGFDLGENASVLALLASYPHRLTTLSAVLPFLTLIKRVASLLAIVLPLLILAFAGLRTWRRSAMPDSVSVPALRELLEGSQPPIVLDVRRPQAFADNPEIIPGATRRLPESVDSWADELPTDCQVVAYCVLGQQVSQGVVARLEQRGIKASFLEGGIEQWRADGGPLQAATPERLVEGPSPSQAGDASQVKR